MLHDEHHSILYAIIFGGGGGAIDYLFRHRRGDGYAHGWLLFNIASAILFVYAFNITFADIYGKWLPLIDLFLGVLTLGIVAVVEEKGLNLLEKFLNDKLNKERK